MTDRELLQQLETLRLKHYRNLDDDYYSCMACWNLGWGEHIYCDCGADEHNLRLDAILEQLEATLTDYKNKY